MRALIGWKMVIYERLLAHVVKVFEPSGSLASDDLRIVLKPKLAGFTQSLNTLEYLMTVRTGQKFATG